MGRKFYVVFQGYQPGVYDNWEDAKAQVDGFHGAEYKSYDNCTAATNAFRKRMDVDEMKFYTFLTEQRADRPDYSAFPEIQLNAIAVDAACNRNPGGDVEYQGVIVGTGERIFHVGPYPGGTNNIGEYIGLVHALALLAQRGDRVTPVYSDSKTALAWLRNRHSRTAVQLPADSKLRNLLDRADAWVSTHTLYNPVYKWNTEEWGEIPADFGRK